MNKTKTKKLEEYEIIIHPIVSEKAVNMIEAENKITFKVNKKANKIDVKNAIEKLYSVKVSRVNVLNDLNGSKKAIVKLDPKNKASELTSKLGMV